MERMPSSNEVLIIIGMCSGTTAHMAFPKGALTVHGFAFHCNGITEDGDELWRSTHSQNVQRSAFQYVLGFAGYGPFGRRFVDV